MPWDAVKLNDGKSSLKNQERVIHKLSYPGRSIPGIAFGTSGQGNGQGAVDIIDQAINLGFSHIDTAQLYRNEAEAGQAFRESGLAREDVFITTKWSGLDGLDVPTSIGNSLKNVSG